MADTILNAITSHCYRCSMKRDFPVQQTTLRPRPHDDLLLLPPPSKETDSNEWTMGVKKRGAMELNMEKGSVSARGQPTGAE